MIKSVFLIICFFYSTCLFAQSLADAKRAMDAERYQKSKEMFDGLLKNQPDKWENYFYAGLLYLKMGSIDSAKIIFDQGISANKREPLNYVGLGAVALLRQDSGLAEKQFQKAITYSDKKNTISWLYIGKAYMDMPNPNYEKAMYYLTRAKEINSYDGQVYLSLGDMYRGMKNNSEAYSAYSTAVDINKKIMRAKLGLGIINRQAKAFQIAVDELNSALLVDSSYGPVYRELAETYYLWANNVNPGQYESKINQALQFYQKYMDLTDRSLTSRMRYADFLIRAKRYKELEKEANEMVQIDHVNPRILRYLGYAFCENGNYEGAIQVLKDFMVKVDTARLISLDYFYLGRAEIKKGAIQQGIVYLGKAIALDSTRTVGISELGKFLYDAQDYSSAAQVYELSIKKPKRSLLDYYYLGASYYFDYGIKKATQKNIDNSLLIKADSAFSYLVEHSPKTYQAFQFKARISRQLDDENDSKGLGIPYYKKYIEILTEIKPELAAKNVDGLVEAYIYLGSVAVRKDHDTVLGKEYFEKVLALDPANSVAKQALKVMYKKK